MTGVESENQGVPANTGLPIYILSGWGEGGVRSLVSGCR